jgi:hypothetical protein
MPAFLLVFFVSSFFLGLGRNKILLYSEVESLYNIFMLKYVSFELKKRQNIKGISYKKFDKVLFEKKKIFVVIILKQKQSHPNFFLYIPADFHFKEVILFPTMFI